MDPCSLVQHHGQSLSIMPTNEHGNLLIPFLGRLMKWLIMVGLHLLRSRWVVNFLLSLEIFPISLWSFAFSLTCTLEHTRYANASPFLLSLLFCPAWFVPGYIWSVCGSAPVNICFLLILCAILYCMKIWMSHHLYYFNIRLVIILVWVLAMLKMIILLLTWHQS